MAGPKKGRRVALLTGIALVIVLAVIAWASWDQILFRIRFESLGLNEQGYPEYRHRQTDIVFVKLPGGEFWMGTTDSELARIVQEMVRVLGEESRENIRRKFDRERPRHKVTLSAFMIGKYEVSQAQWNRIMGSNPSEFEGEKLPVENVSWEDCQEFCRTTGPSLPSEAQWEYACRAGTTTAFAFGETLTTELANVGGAPFSRPITTLEVDSFEPNGFGLFSMHGNVAEWCEEVWDPEFYERPDALGLDPLCRSGSELRVARGGFGVSPDWGGALCYALRATAYR